MVRSLFLLFSPLLLLAFNGCSPGTDSKVLTIGAASSLQPLLSEVAVMFEEETGIHLLISYGASGTLAKQIEEGAPIDVFLSASDEYTDGLAQHGFLRQDSVYPLADGLMVLVRPVDRDATPTLLVDAERLAIANPETAPYGKMAKRLLEVNKLWEAVRDHIVYAETAAQALQFAREGEVDFAFVPLSLVNADDTGVEWAEEGITAGVAGASLTHVAAVVLSTDYPDEATQFAEYLAGEDVAAMMSRFGYSPVFDGIRGIGNL